jgi:hypothetical protein
LSIAHQADAPAEHLGGDTLGIALVTKKLPVAPAMCSAGLIHRHAW